MKTTLNRLATLSLLAAATALVGCNGASNMALDRVSSTNKGFSIRTLSRAGRTRPYGLFIPNVPADRSGYPVIIFLHGMGEGGNDSRANLTVGLAPFVAAQESTFKFICIFPQSDNGHWDEDSANAEDVIAELDEVERNFPVDRSRVSLTGLSTGGHGTYAIGAKYHDRFAALVPMGSNGADLAHADQLTHLAVRAYCSQSGDIFAGWNDNNMCDKINTLGGHAEFIQTPTSGHDCWEYVYGSGELFTWMKQQRRQSTGRTAAPVAAPIAMPTAAAPKMAAPTQANTNLIVNTPY